MYIQVYIIMGNACCGEDAQQYIANTQTELIIFPKSQQFPSQFPTSQIYPLQQTLAYLKNNNISQMVQHLTKQQEQQLATALIHHKQIHIRTAANFDMFVQIVGKQEHHRTQKDVIIQQEKINPQKCQIVPFPSQSKLQTLVIGKCVEGSNFITGEGLILYNSAFYLGQLELNEAQGDGTMSFLSQDNAHIIARVTGLWKQNQILKVNCTDHNNKQIMSLSMDNSREATVHLPNGIIYKGNIKQQKIRKFKQIVTGQGQIIYPNGDHYSGPVLNGEMHTVDSVNKVGILTYEDGRYYKGGFRYGKRHGDGLLMQLVDGTQQILINTIWSDNIPKWPQYVSRVYGDGETDLIQLPQHNDLGPL